MMMLSVTILFSDSRHCYEICAKIESSRWLDDFFATVILFYLSFVFFLQHLFEYCFILLSLTFMPVFLNFIYGIGNCYSSKANGLSKDFLSILME